MLSKLLKNDLKKNMHWLWILFVSTIAVAGITRGCKELGKTIAFFKIMGIFFDSVFYALAVNVILHPFLRNFLNFTKSFYSDEAYLTHTLPVTKTQLINSKYLTALIEMTLGFASLIISILILFISPTMFDFLKMIFATIITGKFSLTLSLILFIILVIVEFSMFLSIIYFAIVKAYQSKEKRFLKAFAISAAMAFASLAVLTVAMIIVLLINKVKFSTSNLILSSSAFISVLLTGIVVYTASTILFYCLAKREFNKGVNID